MHANSATVPTSDRQNVPVSTLRAGMIGIGMIFDETYRPFFEQAQADGGIYDPRFGLCAVELTGVASRTGTRAEAYRKAAPGKLAQLVSFSGADSAAQLLKTDVDFVCVATPDNRHFEAASAVSLAVLLLPLDIYESILRLPRSV